MSGYDKSRVRRIVEEWIDYTRVMLDDQVADAEDLDELLVSTAETHEDLRAMTGLHRELEHDCE